MALIIGQGLHIFYVKLAVKYGLALCNLRRSSFAAICQFRRVYLNIFNDQPWTKGSTTINCADKTPKGRDKIRSLQFGKNRPGAPCPNVQSKLAVKLCFNFTNNLNSYYTAY